MTSKTTIDVEQSRTLFNRISEYDFDNIVTKYMLDCNESRESAEETLVELKRWFTLCVLHPENDYAMGRKMDDMWHIFILFTKDYAKFCQEIAGTFIHHCPEILGEEVDDRNRFAEKMHDGTVLLEADYLKYFGSQPPSHVWPRSQKGETFENAFLFLKALSQTQSQG